MLMSIFIWFLLLRMMMAVYFLKPLSRVEKQNKNISEGGRMGQSRKSNEKKLDDEERELLSSFKNGEWNTVKNVEKEKIHAREAAVKTLTKDVTIEIFIPWDCFKAAPFH